MLSLSSGTAALSSPDSYSVSFPSGRIFSTPLGYESHSQSCPHAYTTGITYSKLDPSREIRQFRTDLLCQRLSTLWVRTQVHIAGHSHILALEPLQHGIRKLSSGVRHTERRAPRSILGLDDFVSAKLDAFRESLDLRLRGGGWEGRGSLREERDDGNAAVAADDGDCVGWCGGGRAGERGNKGRGADDVEGRYAKESVTELS
jgi:hypothetical protein